MKYVCRICGYVYDGDISQEPADYECPVCGAGKSKFEEKE
ncbi:MAG: rubredoxin [Clostridia bacterium]|nr:rubredoxin [Clostridia bacterium]